MTSASQITPELLAHLRSWEGRSESLRETATEAPLLRWAATLGLETIPLGEAGELPPLSHWVYFQSSAPQDNLGADGHPLLGGFMPPVPLPRRMWAGSRVHMQSPVCVGDHLQRNSVIQSVTHRTGRTGDLVFVRVRHEILSDRGTALVEEQDIVYRAAVARGESGPASQAAPAGALWSREVTPSAALLFRYSAITFNAHRIHYDRTYATETEGYAGLVIQGPLIATLLADLAWRDRPQSRVVGFSFKAMRPTTDLHTFRVCGDLAPDAKSAKLWAQDHEGWLTMQADIRFE
jgi:3-methylfumaryl-CoA hydratase